MDKKFKTALIISVFLILALVIFGVVTTTKVFNSDNEVEEIVLYKYREKDKFRTILE